MEQWYSDDNFPRRQRHVIRKDICFKLKGRRSNNKNCSLSNSHVRIAFENFLTIYTAITIQALIISCSDVNNAREQNSDFKNAFQQHMVKYGYPTLLLMCLYCKGDFQ